MKIISAINSEDNQYLKRDIGILQFPNGNGLFFPLRFIYVKCDSVQCMLGRRLIQMAFFKYLYNVGLEI